MDLSRTSRRRASLRWVTLLLPILLAVATLTSPASADAMVSTFTGAFTCGLDGQAIAGARVKLMLHNSVLWDEEVGHTYLDANGAFSFTIRPGSSDEDSFYPVLELQNQDVAVYNPNVVNDFLQIAGLLDPSGLAKTFADLELGDVANWELPRRTDNTAVQDYHTLVMGGERCALFNAFRDTATDYRNDTGRNVPFGQVRVIYDGPNAGVPVTGYNIVSWPENYLANNNDQLRMTAHHEFAHTMRNQFNGTLDYWRRETVENLMMQHHSHCTEPTGLDSQKLVFAWSEGWSDYWAGDTRPCHASGPLDYAMEGDVAYRLSRIQSLCRMTRGDMVTVLADHAQQIRSLQQFQHIVDGSSVDCSIDLPNLTIPSSVKNLFVLGSIKATTVINEAKVSDAAAVLEAAEQKRYNALTTDIQQASATANALAPCQPGPCDSYIPVLAQPSLLRAERESAEVMINMVEQFPYSKLNTLVDTLSLADYNTKVKSIATGLLADYRTESAQAIQGGMNRIQGYAGLSPAAVTAAVNQLGAIETGLAAGRSSTMALVRDQTEPFPAPPYVDGGPTPIGVSTVDVPINGGGSAGCSFTTDPTSVSSATSIGFEDLASGAQAEPLNEAGVSFQGVDDAVGPQGLWVDQISNWGSSSTDDPTAAAGNVLWAGDGSHWAVLEMNFPTPVHAVGFGWWDANIAGNVVVALDAAGNEIASGSPSTGPVGGTHAAFVGFAGSGCQIAAVGVEPATTGEVYGVDNVRVVP